jgi:predicted enzyme related to lactoylglutathione lyase
MADPTLRGRFVWHDLMTPETSGAHAFYSKALGWKTKASQQDPSYSMFATAHGAIGGTALLPVGTPHWRPYIGTSDIEETLQRATALGGSVLTAATPVGGGGQYAVLTDPQGAAFGTYGAAKDESASDAPPKRGDFSWHELATSDLRAAFEFYAALFGWESLLEHDMGPDGIYLVFGRDGIPQGGMFNKPADTTAAWLGYVRVDDVRKTMRKVSSARGSLINGPMEVPGGDWIAQFIDPYGALFAVHALASDMSGESARQETALKAAPASKKAKSKAAPEARIAEAKTVKAKVAKAKPKAKAKAETKAKAKAKTAKIKLSKTKAKVTKVTRTKVSKAKTTKAKTTKVAGRRVAGASAVGKATLKKALKKTAAKKKVAARNARRTVPKPATASRGTAAKKRGATGRKTGRNVKAHPAKRPRGAAKSTRKSVNRAPGRK